MMENEVLMIISESYKNVECNWEHNNLYSSPNIIKLIT
jgi:hypothetical protein